MARFISKICIFIISFIFCACFENDFRALNDEKIYNFDYKKNKLIFDFQKAFAIAFFTKNCIVCDEQIKIINTLKDQYDFDFFVVLGDAKNIKEAKKWVLEKNLKIPVFYEKKASDFLAKAVGGIYGVPTIVFFDKNKNISQKFIGLTPKNILNNEIIKL